MLSSIYDNGTTNVPLYLELNVYKNPTCFRRWSVRKNVEEGIHRIRMTACPQNTIRLGIKTPCSATGVCADCISNTICDQIVITRASRMPKRIKVILVGEELGF